MMARHEPRFWREHLFATRTESRMERDSGKANEKLEQSEDVVYRACSVYDARPSIPATGRETQTGPTQALEPIGTGV
jgi:hypothetical protein